MRIVHYTNRGGRYGNQVIQFAHWIAYAAENPGTEIAFLPYWSLSDQSAGTTTNPFCIYPYFSDRQPRIGIRLRMLHAVCSSPKRRRENMWLLDRLMTPIYGSRHQAHLPREMPMSDRRFVDAIERRSPEIWVSGYGYRDWGLVQKHQTAVREFLRPPAKVYAAAEAFLRPTRERYDLLVGVFIRHGDYRAWEAGRFFFTSAVYATWMRQLIEHFAGRSVCFVIASDENQNEAAFTGLPYALAPGAATGPGHYLLNVAALSLCDYVVTPPSTSGVMPAFFGSIPVIPIIGPEQDLRSTPILNDHIFGCLAHPVMALSIR